MATSTCSLLGTDVFSPPVTQTDILERKSVFYSASDTSSAVININCEKSNEYYTDPSDHWLKVTLKILNQDGTNIAEDAEVALANFALHSLFEKTDVYLNEELITDKSDTYPYEAYFVNTLNYSEKAKEFQFANCLYHKDKAGKFETIGDDNTGFKERKNWTKQSKEIELIGRLRVDMFNQPRLLLNNVGIKLVLTKSPKAFCLMHAAAGNYKIQITNVSFKTTRVKLNPLIANQFERELQKTNAKYPVHHNALKTFDITTGSLQVTKEALYSGRRPRRVIIGLVDADAASGTSTKNPFNFKHFNLQDLEIQFDGEKYPSEGIKVNYADDQFAEAYEHLLIGTGSVNDDKTIGIDRNDFKNGSAIYVISLSPADPECAAFDPVENGQLRLVMNFKAATPNTIRCIVMTENETVYEITKDRKVIKPA